MLGRIIDGIRGGLRKRSENMAIAIKPEEKILPTERAAEALAGEVATEHDMLDAIAAMIETSGTKRGAAARLGISTPFLMDVMIGRRPISAGLAKKMGWERLTLFVRREG